jgi:rubrerythrin
MPKKFPINAKKFKDLLYEAVETEQGGVLVYTKAISCALNEDLKQEWTKYLEQTNKHVDRLRQVLVSFGLDPNAPTPGREVVREIGTSLVRAMTLAIEQGTPEDAQLVACECVVHAETKDHANWELIGVILEQGDLENEALRAAFEEIEDEENEHLYHTKGWCRELAIQGLGLPAVLPPPEEERDVKTAIGAERAKQSRDQMAQGASE